MTAMYGKIFIGILIVVLLSACGSQPTQAPASTPTDAPASPTASPLPTGTPIPTAIPTETTQPTIPPTEAPAQTATISFSEDVLPILESRCLNCHGGDRIEEGLILRTFADIMNGSENGPIVTPGDAENSLMAELVVSQKMPKRGPKLTPPQVQILIDWINQGALNN